jgi:hypothetical protein
LLAGLAGLHALISTPLNLVQRIRRKQVRPWWPLIILGVMSAVLLTLIGVLLLNEGVFYFGLGDVEPALAWLPLAMLLLAVALLRVTISRNRPLASFATMLSARVLSVAALAVGALTVYWGLLIPG